MSGRPSNFNPLYGSMLSSIVAAVAAQVSNAGGWKRPARVASTTNVTVASGLASGSTVDGVTLATGDRVLLVGQSTPAQNGIYIAPSSGAASRADDFDQSAEIVGGLVYVLAGTSAGKVYRNTNNAAIVVGTDAITFSEITASIASIGDIVDVDAADPVDGDTLVYDADTATWVVRADARHSHVVGEPFVGDASATVFYLANEAEEDTVAAYDVNGARVAITQDATEPDKITFAAAPSAGQGWLDYIPATG